MKLTDDFLEKLAEKHVTNCWFDTLTYARAVEAAVREQCAQLCDDMVLYTGYDCAAAIREET